MSKLLYLGVESSLFGCVRNSDSRFHEGLDLYPVKRDDRGEAADPVYAVLLGRVVLLVALLATVVMGATW